MTQTVDAAALVAGFSVPRWRREKLPTNRELVGAMMREVCFSNARDYFHLELDSACAS
jgi:hypothetical protein